MRHFRIPRDGHDTSPTDSIAFVVNAWGPPINRGIHVPLNAFCGRRFHWTQCDPGMRMILDNDTWQFHGLRQLGHAVAVTRFALLSLRGPRRPCAIGFPGFPSQMPTDCKAELSGEMVGRVRGFCRARKSGWPGSMAETFAFEIVQYTGSGRHEFLPRSDRREWWAVDRIRAGAAPPASRRHDLP